MADLAWFDAHLDLACLAENGRDMARDLATCGGPSLPPAVTFPSLREGRVDAFLATVFTEADGDDAVGYPAGDAGAAHARGVAQLERYHAWHRAGLLALTPSPLRRAEASPRRGVESALGGASGALPLRHSATSPLPSSSLPRASVPSCFLLMECADPIRTPDELPWWAERGVAAIGLAWARGSRYAAGNAEPHCHAAHGLTDLGRALVRAMDALGVVHDVSHLSDRAFDELLDAATGPVIATHSNCRALLHDPASGATPPFGHRHLTDAQTRALAARGGVIGLNLYAPFLRSGLAKGERPTIADAIDHVEHVCAVVGHRRAVGLGSDLDGGFSGRDLPAGIDAPAGFARLADELARRGWPDDDIRGFAWGNWARFWRLSAP